MGMLTSGQMGKANRVSEKAMRIYEKKGLLEPEHIDEETGWRYYSIEQSTKFDLILELQQVGFTLDEIVEATKHGDVAYLREMLATKKTQLDEQIANLIIARSVVESYVDGCDRYLYPTLTDQIMLEMMPERRVLMFKLPDELRDSHHAANNLVFISEDGYSVALPMDYVASHLGMLVFDVNGDPLADTVGGVNQLWMGGTSANYFARNIQSIRFEERETQPLSPSSAEAREVYQNLPNVGVLYGGEVR